MTGPQSQANAACTIVSPNYFAFARTVAASYRAQHPGHQFFVLIVSSATDRTPFEGHGFTPVLLSELPLDDMRREAMKFDILELNTNVKPTFLKLLFARYGLETVTYLDPDIFVYSPLLPVLDALTAGASAVLTPHITTPIPDRKLPSEQDHLYNGTYNLGFIALRRSPEADALLDWWERRCLDLGFSEGRTGLFVDQKWMNLAPGLFPNVRILRHPGTNMAYWNLHERELTGVLEAPTVNGDVPLCFFHFSGIVVDEPGSLSNHTNRFSLADRPDLHALFAAYKSAVIAHRVSAAEQVPYGFDQLSDGTAITRLARRIYAQRVASTSRDGSAADSESTRFQKGDPFDARGSFAAFARRHRLVAGKLAPAKNTWREFNPDDRRVQAVHRLLKLALRILGPNRYELLMRYLAHIAVLRNQSVFLGKDD